MADFCKQCSIVLFGKDFGDLANLGNGKPLPKDHGWSALCDECGPILVDNEGRCISDCLHHHHQSLEDET